MLKSSTNSNTLKKIIYNSVDAIDTEHWDSVLKGRNVYLSINYLKSLEKGMKDEMKLFFAISYNAKGEPVLISTFQMVKFIDKRRKFTDHLCHLSYHIQKKIEDIFTVNVLVCGNVFSDGENGFIWTEQLDSEAAFDEVDAVIKQLKNEEELKEKVSITLFKEFWPSTVSSSNQLKKHSYRDFMIDVNMVLQIHESWTTLDDYLMSMKTKFRTRANTVFKKSKDLEIRILSSDDILEQKERIRELFGNVLAKSDFSYGTLTPETFAYFRESLPDHFELRGFYLDGVMIGFNTSFLNNGSLEANFVGLDYECNKEYNVYQRILYDYVEQALRHGAKDLQLGRTSELIKSSIGAMPTNMKLYVKHRKSVSNLLLKHVIQSISPSEFELRKPFKANFTN